MLGTHPRLRRSFSAEPFSQAALGPWPSLYAASGAGAGVVCTTPLGTPAFPIDTRTWFPLRFFFAAFIIVNILIIKVCFSIYGSVVI